MVYIVFSGSAATAEILCDEFLSSYPQAANCDESLSQPPFYPFMNAARQRRANQGVFGQPPKDQLRHGSRDAPGGRRRPA